MMDAISKDEQPLYTPAEEIRDMENQEAHPVVNASDMMKDAEEVKAEEVKEEPEDKPNF